MQLRFASYEEFTEAPAHECTCSVGYRPGFEEAVAVSAIVVVAMAAAWIFATWLTRRRGQ